MTGRVVTRSSQDVTESTSTALSDDTEDACLISPLNGLVQLLYGPDGAGFKAVDAKSKGLTERPRPGAV